MKNLKKVLSLVLALAMALSLMTAAFAADASEYTDYNQIDDTYAEAVSVLTGLGVMEGTSTTSFTFSPNQTITRAEMAAILYRVVTGDVEDEQDQIYAGYAAKEFSDVKADAWYAGYVGYCANQELILGDGNGHFYPLTKINGYQVLAMVLRAIGYDANKEFQGAGWEIRVASTANQTGVTKNIKETSLSSATPREQVAEMVFQALVATPIVSYDATKGYVPATTIGAVNIKTGIVNTYVKGQSLGLKTFDLKQTGLYNIDDWGRPGYIWYQDLTNPNADTYTPNTKDIKVATIKIAPSASYTVKVDECDIAEDLGLKKAADIESGWIDGYQYPTAKYTAITTDANGKIDPLATTSYVGAQGRITEVYDLGDDGYRIVEINTYLAKVTSVTAAKTDKNGHVTAGYSTLEVYTNGIAGAITPYPTNGSTRTLYSTDTSFAKGDYVLVTANVATLAKKTSDGKVGLVATIEAADIVAGGTQTAYYAGRGTTPATITVGGEKYNNADKFVLNLYTTGTQIATNKNQAWDIITDNYGNVIGLVPSATNYLIIEHVRWIADGITGGAAHADVVLADGTKVPDVTISKVGSTAATHNSNIRPTSANGQFTDSYLTNDAYYNHVFTYSVNADGTYTINPHGNAATDVPATSTDTNRAIITYRGTYIYDNNGAVVAVNDNTVFLVADKLTDTGATYTGTTYTAYVGKDNVPTLTNATICYVKPSTSAYASLVVVSSYTKASNTFDAYVYDYTSSRYEDDNYIFQVYKLGETTSTPVKYSQNTLPLTYNGGDISGNGIYTITVNSDNEVTSAQLKILQYSGNDDVTSDLVGDSGQTWNRVTVGENDGTTLVQKVAAGSVAETYYVTNAKVIEVTYDTAGRLVSVAESNIDSVPVGSQTWIGYKDVTVGTVTTHEAAYVYVVKNDVANLDGHDPIPTTWTQAGNTGYYVDIAGSQVYVPADKTLNDVATDWNAPVYYAKPGDLTHKVVSGDTNGDVTVDAALAAGWNVYFVNTSGTWTLVNVK